MNLYKHFLLLPAVLTALSPFLLSSTLTMASQQDSRSSVVALTQNSESSDPREQLVTTFSYPEKQQTATTLYVNKLPVLTFFSPNKDSKSLENTVAQETAESLNKLALASDFDATQISARWKSNTEYEVLYGDRLIVAMNESVTLADSTKNLEQDTLQVANRLRRLLGNAEPITEVANKPKPPKPVAVVQANKSRVVQTMQGQASWYGPGFHGRRTANGERFNQYDMTAAHKTLPFGTLVRVTNLRNGLAVNVRINDRGPYAHGRIIDLSKGSAQQIGLVSSGVASVKVEVLQ